MSEIEKLEKDSWVYDPACGVGGFVFEPLLGKRLGDYYIDNKGNLEKKINYLGNDRDKDTIILAKANMLIFISELLKENQSITAQFAEMFNHVCQSTHKSILGSLAYVNENE